MTHENGFGNDGTESAGSGQPNHSGNQMNEKDDDLTHCVDGIKASKPLEFRHFCISPRIRFNDRAGRGRLLCGADSSVARRDNGSDAHSTYG